MRFTRLQCRKCILALTLICLLCVVPIESSSGNEALTLAIDKLVEKQGFTTDGPGVAILISQPRRLLFKKGYGSANLKQHTPITPQTMFELASVSKTFTSTAILMLHDQGLLSVHDDVRKYIPELPAYLPKRPIHVSDLLQHVSGLPDYMELENVPARHKDYWVNEDYVPEFAKQRKQYPLSFQPGEKYEYNNTNYMLLAVIVERVSKKSFGQFMREAIFAPAGMKHSFVYESPETVSTKHAPGCIPALGYEKGKKQPWRESWGCRHCGKRHCLP